MISKKIKMRFGVIVLSFGFFAGCQQYEINYVGQTQIVEQKIKLPDIEPVDYNGGVKRNNTAFHFILENPGIEDLDYNEFLWLNLSICGQSKYERDLHSALYFPEELKFADKRNVSEAGKSFYAVFIPHLLADMKKRAKEQNEFICAKVIYRYPFELKKVSNEIKLVNISKNEQVITEAK